jgi:hypothetical protein
MLPAIAGITGTHQHAQLFFIWLESHKPFCLGWPGTVIFLISVSGVAGMTGTLYYAHLLIEIGPH